MIPPRGGDRKQLGGEDLAVGGGDEEVGLVRGDSGEGRLGVDVLGLLDRYATLLGSDLDRARDQLLLATLGTVGLGDEGDDVEAFVEESEEGGQGEVAGAEHDEAGFGDAHGGGASGRLFQPG